MNNILIGRYIPGTSLIHKMDPRGKLITSFLFVMIIFLANNWSTYAVLFVFALLAVCMT
ncbi:CbiQ family ECF transporter T component, partial [Lactobacillus iners]